MTTTTFAQWTQTELMHVFGLRLRRRLPELDEWLGDTAEIPDDHRRLLMHFQRELLERGDSWTEEELKLNFIAPLVALVDYNTETTGFFAGRTLRALLGDYELVGTPDGIVASGLLELEKPFFCLHEYIPEKGTETDPRGQLLAAMLAARELNASSQPIYGAYVLGRFWFFAVLSGNDFAVSNDFSATKDEIFEIVRVLLALKKRLPTNPPDSEREGA